MDIRGVIAAYLEEWGRFDGFLQLYRGMGGADKWCVPRVGSYHGFLHQVLLYARLMYRRPLRVIVADEIGLGKTVEAIRLIKYLYEAGEARRILIVVPASLLQQWVNGDLRQLGVPARVIDEESIDELYGYIERGIGLMEGVYIGSMDKLKYSSRDPMQRGRHKPYYDLVSSVRWDLVVIDEAHRLGSHPYGDTLRYERLGDICIEAKHCILLTATPSRGKPWDFAARLAIADPGIRDPGGLAALLESDEGGAVHRAIRSFLLIRRSKEYVNSVEEKRVFPEIRYSVGLVTLSEKEEKLYRRIVAVVARVLRRLGAGRETGLLKAILVKRALSSPYSFLRTLARVTGKRIEAAPREIAEPDLVEDMEIARILRGTGLGEIEELAAEAAELAEKGDSAVEALATLIAYTRGPGAGDMAGNGVVVFTEYLDTANYIYRHLPRLLENYGYRPCPPAVQRRVLGAVEREACRANPQLRICRGRAARGLLEEHTRLLCRGLEDTLIVMRLSSENRVLLPIYMWLLENIDNPRLYRGRLGAVLVSTDIAAEGLNMQKLNVLVNYEVPWSPVKREQRIGRVHRLRQTRTVHIIDFVRDTEVDHVIYENLLAKITSIAEATGTARPVGGVLRIQPRRVSRAAAAAIRFYDLEELDEYNVLTRLGDALEASLRGEEIDTALLADTITRLFSPVLEAIKQYNRFAKLYEEKPPPRGKVVGVLEALFGCGTEEEAAAVVEKLYAAAARLAGEEPRQGMDMGRMLLETWRLLGGQAAVSGEAAAYIVPGAGEPGLAVGFVYRVTMAGEPVYSSPAIAFFDENLQLTRVETGCRALEWIADHAALATPIGGDMAEAPQPQRIIEGNEIRVKHGLLHRVYRAARIEEKGLARYLDAMGRLPGYKAGWRSPRGLGVELDGPWLLAVIPRVEDTGGEGHGDPVVGRRAEEIVYRMLVEKGYIVEETHFTPERYSYDIRARPPGSMEPVYIEVKGHRGPVFTARLTPAETQMALRYPDKYIVCLVAYALTENPLVLCKPFSELEKKLLRRDTVIVSGATEALVRFT